jgi:hypothetical protein
MSKFSKKDVYNYYHYSGYDSFSNGNGFLTSIVNNIVGFLIFNGERKKILENEEKTAKEFLETISVKTALQYPLVSNKKYFIKNYNGENILFPETANEGDIIVLNFSSTYDENITVKTNVSSFTLSSKKNATVVALYGLIGYERKSKKVKNGWNLTVTEI